MNPITTCNKSELDLFLAPHVQTNIEQGKIVEIFPVSNVGDSGPIEFCITGSGDEFTDLRGSWLYFKVKVTKANGTDLGDDDRVAPANDLANCMIAGIDVTLNDKLISSSTNTNPFRAMITNLLSYGTDAKTSQLQSELFFKDTAGRFDNVDPLAEAATRNSGLHERYTYCQKSNTFELMTQIHQDIFQQDRLILNGVTIRLRLNRSKNAFCLLSPTDGADFKVVIQEASFHVRKVKIHNDTFLGIAAALRHAPALYPIRRVDCKAMSIPAGQMTFSPDDIFLGQVPIRLLLTLVENTAFNGSYKKNPFRFQHFDASQVGVYVNGESTPSKALQLNYDQSQYLMGYMSLFHGTGQLFHDKGLQISRDEYPNGYCMYAFDLSPDLSSGTHTSLIKQGNLRVGLQFAKPLPTMVNLILYAEFDSVIEIDHNRNVTFNWAS